MATRLIAIDVGNSRVKWGRFDAGELVSTASHPVGRPEAVREIINDWLEQADLRSGVFAVASVNPEGSEEVVRQLRETESLGSRLVQLTDVGQLPIEVRVDNPSAVGIDRLLNAVAVNARRPERTPALVIDCGSAITVDAVDQSGAFVGGAILPGLGLAARALAEFTYWLPRVDVNQPPEPLGKNTEQALRSGLYWGTVGGLNELVRRLSEELGGQPVVYITGGDAALLSGRLEQPAVLIADLTLHGIRETAEHMLSARQ